jgi:hypothetical protein
MKKREEENCKQNINIGGRERERERERECEEEWGLLHRYQRNQSMNSLSR